MEINTIYSNARYTGLFGRFRLERLLARLEEKFEVKAVECASVISDRIVDMRVAFSDPAVVQAEVSEKITVDREGYSWVRFAKRPEGGDWTIAFKREGFVDCRPAVAARWEELVAESAADWRLRPTGE